jgi:hypothetical protein
MLEREYGRWCGGKFGGLRNTSGVALLCLENNEQDWLHEAKVLPGAGGGAE